MGNQGRWLALGLAIAGLVFGGGCGGREVVISTSSPSTEAASILAEAAKKLEAAESYRFTVHAVHYWTFEGKPQEWVFEGEGAFARPGRFRSWIEGPADSYLSVEIKDGKVRAWDTRGEVAGASTAFGGPGFGTAPYTVIAYLKNAWDVTQRGVVSLGDGATYSLAFRPELSTVAAMDVAHAQAMERVIGVEGEVWVDKASGSLRRERVSVEFLSQGGERERAVVTLEFLEFNRPVGF